MCGVQNVEIIEESGDVGSVPLPVWPLPDTELLPCVPLSCLSRLSARTFVGPTVCSFLFGCKTSKVTSEEYIYIPLVTSYSGVIDLIYILLGKTIVMVLLCHSSQCGCFVCFA